MKNNRKIEAAALNQNIPEFTSDQMLEQANLDNNVGVAANDVQENKVENEQMKQFEFVDQIIHKFNYNTHQMFNNNISLVDNLYKNNITTLDRLLGISNYTEIIEQLASNSSANANAIYGYFNNLLNIFKLND